MSLQKRCICSSIGLKEKYWPKYVYIDTTREHFTSKPTRYVDLIGGHLDGIEFKIFCMKEAGYIMMLILTYAINEYVHEKQKLKLC